MDKLRELQFKALYWCYEETDDYKLNIYVSGLTAKHKTVFVKIEGFTPFAYLQLPKRMKWNTRKCRKVFEHFKDLMQSEAPIKWSMYEKFLLYHKEKTNVIMMTFPTHKAARKFSYKCSRRLSIPGVGTFTGGEFRVHEHNIPPVIKFASVRDIKLAGWLKIKEKPLDEDDLLMTLEERQFTSSDIDMKIRWDSIDLIEPPKGIIIKPKYCSFDLECNSINHNSKIPDPNDPRNPVFQISMVFGRFGGEIEKKILLTLFDPLNIKDVEIRRYKTEANLLLGFTKTVQEEDPDIFLGYNIMKFDWNYMIVRSDVLGVYMRFAKLGRILNKRAVRIKQEWSSSAYGKQEFQFFDCHGRSNVDVLLEVERNYRLPKYSLDYVSEKFLGDHKDSISARELFMLYQITEEFLDKTTTRVSKRRLKRIKIRIASILERRKIQKIVKRYRRSLMKATVDNIHKLIRKAMYLTGKYCVKDTLLPIALAEKLVLWTTMEEMSNCMNVPTSYLHTRGQQIKVLAQVYKETIYNDMIIPFKDKKDKKKSKYQGATVVEANPGFYKKIATLDFASLYPTIMITFNISYDTLLKDDDPIPDSECHVLEWHEHIACIVGDTRVSLLNTSKEIQKFERGSNKVYARNLEGISLFNQTAFFNQGLKECVELTMEDGTTLKCTPDHRILTSENKWVEAQNLKINQCVKMTYNPPVYDPEEYTLSFADLILKGQDVIKFVQLLGLLLTDGSLTKGRCKIYTGHPLDNDSVKFDIEHLFGLKIDPKKENYGWSFTILGKYGAAFRSLQGIILGTKSKGRCIPDFLFKCPKGVLAAFLSGMFGGDGHTISFSKQARSFSSIELSWTSDTKEELEKVFRKLSILLEKVGFHPTMSRCKKETKLHIPISETIQFHKKIGFAHCVHKSVRLEAGCLYLRHRKQVWNQQKRIVENVRMERDKYKKERKKYKMVELIKNAVSKEEIIYNKYYSSPTSLQMSEHLRQRKKWDKPMFSRKHFLGPMEYMEKIGARDIFSEGNSVVYAVNIKERELPMFNIQIIHRKSIGIQKVYDLEVDISHSFVANGVIVHNCTHDPQKRKRKPEAVLCGKHRHRFRKVKIVIHEDGRIERLYEGVMARLERKLLTERKIVKKEMAKMKARLKMQRGKADSDELKYWKKIGYEIIEEGLLSDREEQLLSVCCNILDAQQKALKVSANSVPEGTKIPCMVNGKLANFTIEKISDGNWVNHPNGEASCPIDGIKVWTDSGFTAIKYVFRHKHDGGLVRVITNTGSIDCTGDHSLLRENGKTVKPSNLKVGDRLLHKALPENTQVSRLSIVEKILNISNRGKYVYDIETENHHFAAGDGDLIIHNSAYGAMGAGNGFIPLIPGAASVTAMGRWLLQEAINRTMRGWPFTRLIYGDTDSIMLKFEGKTLSESFKLAEEISVVVTNYLKCIIMKIDENFTVKYKNKDIPIGKVKPEHHKGLSREDLLKVLEYNYIPIDLEFENMYGVFLLFTKKRYVARVVNKEGKVVSTTVKGVVGARRDNCKFLRDTHDMIYNSVLDEKSEKYMMNYLYDQITSLFCRGVKDEDLIIYVGVKDVMEYAKKKIQSEHSSDINPFIDILGNAIEDVSDTLDPRLVYQNLPQCLLALKMLRRGDDVPANTRLEFIYLNTPGWEHQGDKAEDYTYYRENKDILKPDYLHYLEKQLSKPITEIINVKYPRTPVPYEKLEDHLDRLIGTLDDLQSNLMYKTREFIKPEKENSVRSYRFRRKAARVEFILKSASEGGINKINSCDYSELIKVCKRWKSRDILNRLYKQYGMKKRPSKRPYRNGPELPRGMSVMLIRGRAGYIPMSLCNVIEAIPVGNTFKYSLLMNEKQNLIIYDIPRSHISTYLYKDGTVMKDILTARTHYLEVVMHLNDLFSPISFED